jgi:hypothetical protein
LLFLAVNAFIYLRHPYLTYRFRRKVGYFPDVALPLRYHEKVYWRKVFDRNPAFEAFCDKLKTKAWFRAKLPGLKVVETLWTGRRLDGAAMAILADRNTVLKGNHGSGFNLFATDRDKGTQHIDKTVRRWMARNHARRYYQPAYRNADRLLLIEPLVGNGENPVVDYYVRAARGRVILVSVLVNTKRPDQRFGYFGERGERLTRMEPNDSSYTLPPDFELPATYAAAMAHAREFSRDFDYVRVDFMSAGDELYAGEVTIYPNAGLTYAGNDPATDLNAATNLFWDLRNSHFFEARHWGIVERYKHGLKAALDEAGKAAT